MDEDVQPTTTRRSWPEEDTTPTTQREIHGFYSYGIAAEVFAVVGVGAFLPVTLEQLARENGVLYSDRQTPCVSSTTARLLTRASESVRDPDQCVVHLFGTDITTASFAMYTFSAAVTCQALVLISFSAFADYGDNRKRLLLTFGTIGALTSMSFMFVVPKIYLVAALLVILVITCLGSSFVVLNSFLPLLAANHPSIKDRVKEHELSAMSSNTPELQISTQISSAAVGLGYGAAVFVQSISIVILYAMNRIFGDSISNTLPLRVTLLIAGLWWLSFMAPTALWLRERPGPTLQDSRLSASQSKVLRFFAYVRFAWSSLWHTIKTAAQLKQMVIFLIAWFLLSDAQASVSGTAILYARTELKIGTIGIAALSITAIASGIFGSLIWPILSRRLHWSSNQTVVACLCLMEVVPLYGLMGYLPFIQNWGVGGLQNWWEIYPLAFIFGTVMGGNNSYCRSLYGSLVPPGHEAAFFALFAITDKGSSAIGPTVVGRIVDATGRIRPAFWFLAVLIALPIPLVWWVDPGKGQADAQKMAVRLQEAKGLSIRLRDVDRRAEAEGLMHEER